MGNPNRLTNYCGVKNSVTVDSEIPGSAPRFLFIVSSVVNQAGWKFFLQIFANCTGFFLIYFSHSSFSPSINPNVAKVEGAADPRRQGRSCSELLQALDNAGDAVSSAFPKGKQTGDFSLFIDTTDGHVFWEYPQRMEFLAGSYF